jgi:hypothetical protein
MPFKVGHDAARAACAESLIAKGHDLRINSATAQERRRGHPPRFSFPRQNPEGARINEQFKKTVS